MKYFKKFINLNDAKTQGNIGLNSPHVDIIEGFDVANYYEDTNDMFTCDFDNSGRIIISALSKNYISFTSTIEQTVSLSAWSGEIKVEHLEYSFDRSTWNTWDYSALSFGTTEQPTIYFRGKNPNCFSQLDDLSYFIFSSTEASVDIDGNIMSIVDYDVIGYIIPNDYYFQGLFLNCTAIKSVSLNFLPATVLTIGCYTDMFNGCTNLVSAPNLPATGLSESCYSTMFCRCSSLVSAPALPATTLAPYCYDYMFSDCVNLISMPNLPATTLSENCYYCMFMNCSSLASNVLLPAPILVDSCYNEMFSECSSLNEIHCDATNITADNCLNSWVSGVALNGHFYGKTAAGWTDGVSGIPDGWEKHME